MSKRRVIDSSFYGKDKKISKNSVLKLIDKYIIDFESEFDDKRTLEVIKLLEKLHNEILEEKGK